MGTSQRIKAGSLASFIALSGAPPHVAPKQAADFAPTNREDPSRAITRKAFVAAAK